MKDMNEKIKEKLEEYEIESVEEFEPSFYTQNLVNGRTIEKKAINNLLNNYKKEELILIENYNECGIVEFVASNQFHIEDNKIIIDD